MTQVVQELANVRLEAEKLSAENESLNKNYESLLKVSSFSGVFRGIFSLLSFRSMGKIWLSILQVVERERTDSKAEQEKLNTQIQECLREAEVIMILLIDP